jgi:hypothetical protein
MADETKKAESQDGEDARTARRRAFLQTAAKVAVTTPVVTLMLSAGTKRTVQAGPYGYLR